MKKILILIAVALIATSAFAQKPTLGVKGGINVSSITDSDANSKASIYLGVFAEFKINDFVGLAPELVYSRQGGFDKNNGNKSYFRLNYLNVPLMVNLYLADKFTLNLGPQLGLKLNSVLVTKGGGHTDKDKDNDINSFDLSFGIGGSYALTSNIDLNLRYNLGLTKLYDTGSNKNSVFQIGVAYKFNCK